MAMYSTFQSQADRPDLLEAVLEAQSRAGRYGTAAELELSARKLADVAQTGEFDVLFGASAVADHLVGACVVLASGRLSVFDPHRAGVPRLLLVDAACAGPLSLARSAALVRRLGVRQVGAAVFDATFSVRSIDGIDELWFMDVATHDRLVLEPPAALTA